MAIPHKIISIKGTKAKVVCGTASHTLDIRLTPKAKVGDYLMNENDFAVHIVPEKEALGTLKLFNK